MALPDQWANYSAFTQVFIIPTSLHNNQEFKLFFIHISCNGPNKTVHIVKVEWKKKKM